jgi:hypothetical protein
MRYIDKRTMGFFMPNYYVMISLPITDNWPGDLRNNLEELRQALWTNLILPCRAAKVLCRMKAITRIGLLYSKRQNRQSRALEHGGEFSLGVNEVKPLLDALHHLS